MMDLREYRTFRRVYSADLLKRKSMQNSILARWYQEKMMKDLVSFNSYIVFIPELIEEVDSMKLSLPARMSILTNFCGLPNGITLKDYSDLGNSHNGILTLISDSTTIKSAKMKEILREIFDRRFNKEDSIRIDYSFLYHFYVINEFIASSSDKKYKEFYSELESSGQLDEVFNDFNKINYYGHTDLVSESFTNKSLLFYLNGSHQEYLYAALGLFSKEEMKIILDSKEYFLKLKYIKRTKYIKEYHSKKFSKGISAKEISNKFLLLVFEKTSEAANITKTDMSEIYSTYLRNALTETDIAQDKENYEKILFWLEENKNKLTFQEIFIFSLLIKHTKFWVKLNKENLPLIVHHLSKDYAIDFVKFIVNHSKYYGAVLSIDSWKNTTFTKEILHLPIATALHLMSDNKTQVTYMDNISLRNCFKNLEKEIC